MQKSTYGISGLLSLFAILLVAGLLYLPALDDNHVWWGDFALYMSHARNIATGVPYADTGYVVNPDMPWISPHAYPPVFSYLLAPIYGTFELNLYAPKLFNFAVFLLLVVMFHYYAARHLEDRMAVFGATVALALSPWYWEMKNLVLSDVPFATLTLAAVLIATRLDKYDLRTPGYWVLVASLGTMFYLAYGTRSLGITLPAALVAYDLLKHRKIRLGSIVTLALFFALYTLQNVALGTDRSYANAMIEHAMQGSDDAAPGLLERALIFMQYLLGNARDRSAEYIWIVQAYWDNGVSLALRAVMVLLTAVLAVIGYIGRIRRNLSFAEVFVAVYVGTLLVVPFIQSNRYLLPVVPFFLFYIFVGAETLAASSNRIARYLRQAPAAMLALVLLSYAGFYAAVSWSAHPYGVKDILAVEMYDYIKTDTPDDCLIIFKKPRILALFTGRRAMIYSRNDTPEQLWEDFRATRAAYLVLSRQEHSVDEVNYRTLIESNPHRLEAVFENAGFKVFRVLETPGPRTSVTGGSPGGDRRGG